ncbi:MAG: transcription elongation factor GreA [Rickettsiales bacterium]|jgi:transcription elongation factor GreA|nr:transcription elongation factor GreA [Rickettsiales bacterium]
MDKFQITKSGYTKLKELIENLKIIERPKVISQIAAAREIGDLRENADYHASREKQAFIEAQIADLEDKYLRAEIIDISKLFGNKVLFGATVKIENLDNGKITSYKIVSDFEADLDKGLISNTSPVARAMIGKEIGEEIEIKTPGGITNYEILAVNFIE